MPVIELSDPDAVAGDIERACRDTGFFYVTGHGVPASLRAELDAHAREFFALPEADKAEIAMPRGGKAWRGWFPVGGELTSGAADLKEGLYFGTELPAGHPLPLHGPNLFPRQVPGLRPAVLSYVEAPAGVGPPVAAGLRAKLGLDVGYFPGGFPRSANGPFRI